MATVRRIRSLRGIPAIFAGVGVVALVLGLAVLGTLVWRKHQAARARREGMAAAEQNRVVAAVRALGLALRLAPEDAEGWATFARVRERLLAPDQKHYPQAIAAWGKSLEQDPGVARHWLEYAHTLEAVGDWEHAARAARKAWTLNPDLVESLHLWVSASIARHDTKTADEILADGLERHPDDWRLLLDQLLVDQLLERPTEPIVADLEQRLAGASADARWHGIIALERRLAGNRVQAEELFRAAARRAPADPDYLRWLIPLLDEIGASDAVLPLFETHPQVLTDGRLSLVFARRAWETDRPDLLLQMLGDRPWSLATDPEIAALCGMARSLVQGESAARSYLGAIEYHADVLAEQLWRPALEALVLPQSLSPQQARQACDDALRVTATAPVLHYRVAQAWNDQQEYRMSAKATALCGRYAPEWYAPRYLEAIALIRAGLPDAAYGAAFRALSLAPRRVDAALAFATAWLMSADPGEPAGTGSMPDLLNWLDELRRNVPEEAAFAVDLLRVQSLLKAGLRDNARALLTALEQSPESRLSGSEELRALRAACDPRDAAATETTALIPLSRVPGKPQPGTATERVHNDFSPALPADTATDERATGWRLLQARELLAGEPTEKTAAEAANLLRPVLDQLPDHPDAHLLSALALARLHNPVRAGEHLLDAVRSDWRRSTDAMRLALTLREQGLWPDAPALVRLWVSATQLSERLAWNRRFRPAVKEQHVAAAAGEGLRRSLVVRLLALAELAEQINDGPVAEATYRELMRTAPEEHSAWNNLAMRLIGRTGSGSEALRLARRAVELAPQMTAYQETLAQIEAAFAAELSNTTPGATVTGPVAVEISAESPSVLTPEGLPSQ